MATAVAGMLEWYDFSIFGFMAAEIGDSFFDDGGDSLVKALGVFGGAFIARPIGGIIFGHLGDSGGVRDDSMQTRRLRALEGSLLLMALPAIAITVLPTRAAIGPAAPVASRLAPSTASAAPGGRLERMLTAMTW